MTLTTDSATPSGMYFLVRSQLYKLKKISVVSFSHALSSWFSFQPCVSLESALSERLEKFTASETLKIMATEVSS